MSTLTSRLGLYKPAASGVELVNVVTDLNNNLDSIDAKMGAFACTSGTRPGTPYDGQIIRETDTNKMFVWCADLTQWRQILFSFASFDNDLNIPLPRQIKIGTTASSASFAVGRASGTDYAFSSRRTADVGNNRFDITADGVHEWGDGTTIDTNLYRNGANVLKTDDSLQVVGALNVTGTTTLGDLDITNSLDIGSARFRPILSANGTVANTTTETVIATLTIPAGDAVVGAVYRITVRALASVTATPTLTIRGYIGGLGGSRIGTSTGVVLSSASNATNHPWHADLYYTIVSTGAGGTGRGHFEVHDTLSLGGNVPFTGVRIGLDANTAAVAHDTTAAKDLVLSVQWSAASTLNTTTVFIVDAARVA